MPTAAILIMSKSIVDLRPLEKILNSNELCKTFVHIDYESKLRLFDSVPMKFHTRSRWGSPELAFAQVESMYEIFKKYNFDYIISISDDTVPVIGWMPFINSMSRNFTFPISQGLTEAPLGFTGVNYGITSKSKGGIWNRKWPLTVVKGSQWVGIDRGSFFKIWELMSDHQVLDNLYHTQILDERIYPTLMNECNIQYINRQLVYAPFGPNGKNTYEISLDEYKMLQNKFPFARKYNWDNPKFKIEM